MSSFIINPYIVGDGSIPSGTVQLGTAGTPSANLGKAPFSYAWDYTWAGWIIQASELSSIGGAVNITSLEIYLGSQSDATYTMNNQEIWCSHIGSRSSFSGNLPNVDFSGYADITDRTQCKTPFSKTYNSPADVGTWIKFTFDTAFEWNGVDNIAFDWVNKDTSFDFGGPQFDIQSISGSVAYKRQDGSYPTGVSLLDAERPIMKINYNE